MFAARETLVEYRSDGSLVLRSPIPFEIPRGSILDFLPLRADKAPDRIFLVQRGAEGAWETITYAQTWQRVRSVATGLLSLGAKAGDNYEVRVKGPNVTPGYDGQPETSAAAFDDEGYYRIGDTVAFLYACIFEHNACCGSSEQVRSFLLLRARSKRDCSQPLNFFTPI